MWSCILVCECLVIHTSMWMYVVVSNQILPVRCNVDLQSKNDLTVPQGDRNHHTDTEHKVGDSSVWQPRGHQRTRHKARTQSRPWVSTMTRDTSFHPIVHTVVFYCVNDLDETPSFLTPTPSTYSYYHLSISKSYQLSSTDWHVNVSDTECNQSGCSRTGLYGVFKRIF